MCKCDELCPTVTLCLKSLLFKCIFLIIIYLESQISSLLNIVRSLVSSHWEVWKHAALWEPGWFHSKQSKSRVCNYGLLTLNGRHLGSVAEEEETLFKQGCCNYCSAKQITPSSTILFSVYWVHLAACNDLVTQTIRWMLTLAC